jgi:hypothetical protein
MSRIKLLAMILGASALGCANQTTAWAPDAPSAKARPLLVATEPPPQTTGEAAATPGTTVERMGIDPYCIPSSRDSVSTKPKVRMGASTVNGDLPPEVVQRIVRQNFVSFRTCYERALERTPDVSGLVRIGFTIARDGSITDVRDAGSKLPDRGMIDCLRTAYSDLNFPQPTDGEVVNVVMPMFFCPPLVQPIEPPPEPEEPE